MITQYSVMKKFNKMTALCSESFVHYCQTEKESEGGKEKEKTVQICFWASEHLNHTQRRTKEKRSYNKHTAFPTKQIHKERD